MNHSYSAEIVDPGDSWSVRVLSRVLAFWAFVYVFSEYIPNAGMVICYAAAVYALRGSRQTIEAFTVLSFVILMGGTGGALARFVVIFAGFVRAAWDTFLEEAPLPRILWPLTVFALSVLVMSLLTSRLPLVSALKIVSFWTGVATATTMLYRTRNEGHYWLNWFITFAVFLVFGSMLIYLTGGGYDRTAAGFQGVTSHPQTFGPVVAICTALLGGLAVYYGGRKWYIWLGFVLALGGVYLSAARTAFLATFLALGIAMLVGKPTENAWWQRMRSTLLHPVAILVYVGIFGLVIIQWSAVQSRVVGFLVKDKGSAESVVGALQASRGSLAGQSMQNFRSEPITGIGFGVPSEVGENEVSTGFLGLPTGASVEKGFMPTAVLEETGLVGALLVVILIALLIRPVWRSDHVPYLWIIFICMLINLGEMVFFSMGGMGFFLWLIIAYVHTQSIRILETRNLDAG